MVAGGVVARGSGGLVRYIVPHDSHVLHGVLLATAPPRPLPAHFLLLKPEATSLHHVEEHVPYHVGGTCARHLEAGFEPGRKKKGVS